MKMVKILSLIFLLGMAFNKNSYADADYDYWVDAWDRAWLERNGDKLCPEGKQCKLIEVFDSSQIADQVIQ
ncbi:hypothetical protein [Methylomonas sp. 11b]|uniref:hypothetical protein n=1 Tax=Methylomonas sp. 11b TaxID=1168169 RepID=UPI00047E7616|nr:hypothetical protein [Methylomonas sp. 11b]